MDSAFEVRSEVGFCEMREWWRLLRRSTIAACFRWRAASCDSGIVAAVVVELKANAEAALVVESAGG